MQRQGQRRLLPRSVASGDIQEAVSRGAEPQRTEARARLRIRWGRIRPDQQASLSARAPNLLSAFGPFPESPAGGEEAAENNPGGPCGELQEIAPVDHPANRDAAASASTLVRPHMPLCPQSRLIDPASQRTGEQGQPARGSMR